MFGDTISLGPVDGVDCYAKRINQDGYSSEYSFRNGLRDIRVRIRHSKETAKVGLPLLERHNVLVSENVFATPTQAALFREFSSTFRCSASDSAGGVHVNAIHQSVMYGLSGSGSPDTVLRLASWES